MPRAKGQSAYLLSRRCFAKSMDALYGYETSLPKLKIYHSTFTMLLKRDETKRNEKIKLDLFNY
jgi:hypothetical protein